MYPWHNKKADNSCTHVIQTNDGELYFAHSNGLTARDKIASRAEARINTHSEDVEILAILIGHVTVLESFERT